MATKKFPKTLYVKTVTERDGTSYFVADEAAYGLAEMGEKVKIGTYQLVETNTAEMIMDICKAK